MKIASIVGARPQFIKAAAVSRALQSDQSVEEVLVHTGQHYDDNMSSVFFRELDIPQARYTLEVGSGNHGAQTAQMLERIERVLMDESPDGVLVYGDTNSTLAGALAAAKLRIPVAHIEAGLRSYNRAMPEETNRVVTDHLSDLLLAPSSLAIDNLRREGLQGANVRMVGDVMFDAALYYGAKAETRSRILERLGLSPGAYVLATIHRAENTDDLERLRAIFQAFCTLAEEVPIVLPIHPRTRAALARAESSEKQLTTGLTMIEPQGYLDMMMLEKHAKLIATDSGGVQKEAYFHAVPCATLRTETEWMELVQCGWNHLVAPLAEGAITQALRGCLEKRTLPPRLPLFGDGQAAFEIVRVLNDHWRGSSQVRLSR
jgi:UDP-GlcNAc3NAcA epimerase